MLAQLFQARRGGQRLVRAIQRDHRDGRSASKDACGGFRVDVDVELRGGRDVAAFRKCTAHHHDLSQMAGQARLLRHRQRDVGERRKAA